MIASASGSLPQKVFTMQTLAAGLFKRCFYSLVYILILEHMFNSGLRKRKSGVPNEQSKGVTLEKQSCKKSWIGNKQDLDLLTVQL